MHPIRRIAAAALLAAAVAVPAHAQQQPEGPWMVRVRALGMIPADRSDAIPALGVEEDAITVSRKVFPEVDVSYFLTPRIAAELILTYPQEHEVEVDGTEIGTFKHLPPTLLLQYHPLPDGAVKPYLGAGVNLTLLSDVELAVPGVGALDLEDRSVGPAGQAGVDIRLGRGRYLNLDVKRVMIRSDVLAGGETVSEVRVDPWLLSAGFAVRF